MVVRNERTQSMLGKKLAEAEAMRVVIPDRNVGLKVMAYNIHMHMLFVTGYTFVGDALGEQHTKNGSPACADYEA